MSEEHKDIQKFIGDDILQLMKEKEQPDNSLI